MNHERIRHDDTDESAAEMRSTDEGRWRVDHKVPVTLIITLLIQTGAGIAFFANLSSKVDQALALMSEFKAERYTKEDAKRDRELFQVMISTVAQRDIETDRRLDSIERQLTEHRYLSGNGTGKLK